MLFSSGAQRTCPFHNRLRIVLQTVPFDESLDSTSNTSSGQTLSANPSPDTVETFHTWCVPTAALACESGRPQPSLLGGARILCFWANCVGDLAVCDDVHELFISALEDCLRVSCKCHDEDNDNLRCLHCGVDRDKKIELAFNWKLLKGNMRHITYADGK